MKYRSVIKCVGMKEPFVDWYTADSPDEAKALCLEDVAIYMPKARIESHEIIADSNYPTEQELQAYEEHQPTKGDLT